MTEWNIYGMTLHFDAEDAEEAEKLESAFDIMEQRESELVKLKEKKVRNSFFIRAYCNMYDEFFSAVFGSDAADKMFQNQKKKPSIYENALCSFMDFVIQQNLQISKISRERFAKYKIKK